MSKTDRRSGWSELVTRLVRGRTSGPATPEAEPPALRVTSHVARDLLQNAAYFNSLPKAVAEYVSNAIDNALPGKAVHCAVTLAGDEIRIVDDASGMSYAELFGFFQMHGENAQRRRGRAVRGKFGTGKSAAFGIADVLQIATVRGGRRNVVELHRADVEAARDGRPISVREVAVDVATRAAAGTTIIIRNMRVKHVDPDGVRSYLERLLGRHLRLHEVLVNGTACRYREPNSTKTFRFKAQGDTAELLGPATCILKISREPLARDENAVAVLCNGFLHATTLAGKQAEPFIEYVFGEVGVPSLDADDGPVPAFDNTRNLSLNPHNPRVQALLAWLAECLETVRQELVARDKRRRYSREMRQLRKLADEIQGFLDDDFRMVQAALPWATLSGTHRRSRDRARPGRRATRARQARDSLQRAAPKVATLVTRGRTWINRLLGRAPTDDAAEALANLRRGRRVQFEINCVRLGAASPRSRYIANRRAIYLNRDHPQLRAAEAEAGIQSVTLKMLLYDIAFTEYALAVVSQLADQGIEVADPIDASEMVQEILDRLGRKAAEHFYAQQDAKPGPAEDAPDGEPDAGDAQSPAEMDG